MSLVSTCPNSLNPVEVSPKESESNKQKPFWARLFARSRSAEADMSTVGESFASETESHYHTQRALSAGGECILFRPCIKNTQETQNRQLHSDSSRSLSDFSSTHYAAKVVEKSQIGESDNDGTGWGYFVDTVEDFEPRERNYQDHSNFCTFPVDHDENSICNIKNSTSRDSLYLETYLAGFYGFSL